MLEFVSLSPLAWLLAIAVVLVVGWRFSLVDRPAGLSRWGSLVLRAAAILLLILALCRPFAPQKNDRVHANFLLDVSEMIDLDAAIGAVDKIGGWIKSSLPATRGRSSPWGMVFASSRRPMICARS